MSKGMLVFAGLVILILVAVLATTLITSPQESNGENPIKKPSSQPVILTPKSSTDREPVFPKGDMGSNRSAEIFRVKVLDQKNCRIIGARVAICDPHPTESVSTDSHGVAEFSQRPRIGSKIVAVAPGRFPACVDADPILDEQVVHMTGKVAVSGKVRVNGRPPLEPVPIKLTGYKNPMADAAPTIRSFLSQSGFDAEGMEQNTSDGGRFSFYGLPEGKRITLRFPAWFRLCSAPDGPPTVDLITPKKELVIDLTASPSIRGRPVDGPSTGMEGSNLKLKFAFYGDRDQHLLRSGELQCRTGKVFRIPYAERNVTKAEVSLWNPDRSLFARREVTGDFTRGRDLGDISRASLVKVRLFVYDNGGTPIPNARGEAMGHVSEKTGINGMTRFLAPNTAQVMRVGAPGYEIKTISIDLQRNRDVIAYLQNTTTLAIEVRHGDGSIPRGMGVQMAFNKKLPDQAVEHFPEFADVKGTRNSGAFWGGDQHKLFYQIEKHGKILVSNLTTDETFSVDLQDQYFHIIRSERVSLKAGEKRNIKWILPERGKRIRGRIVDKHDQPLKGVKVHLGFAWWRDVKSGNDGCFLLEDIYENHPEMRLSLDGYASMEDHNIDLSGSDLVRTYCMDAGRTLWIEVVDGNKKRREVKGLTVLCHGYADCGGVRRGKGYYQVDDVANSPAQIVVDTNQGKLRYNISADVKEKSLVIE